MRSLPRIATGLLLCLATASLGALPVDLGMSELRVAPGFSLERIERLPDPVDPDWVRVRPPRGERTLLIRELGIPGALPWKPFDIKRGEPREYTVLWPFQADLALLNASDPAVFLGHVGQGWELYLNGVLLRDELELAADGSLARERSMANALIPIDQRALKRGTNILALRIVGDPQSDRTGFQVEGPYLVDRFTRLRPLTLEYLDLMLAGVCFFLALYHILLYALRPGLKTFLAYGVGTLLLSIYLVSRSNLAAGLLGDTRIARSVEYGALFLAGPLIVFFVDELLKRRASAIAWAYLGVSAALAAAVPFFRPELFLLIWQLLALPVLVWILASRLLVPLAAAYREELAALPSAARLGRRLGAFRRALVRTEAGQLLLALGLTVPALLADLAAARSSGRGGFSSAAFLVLVLGTAVVLARRFAEAYGRMQAMNETLGARVEERTAALTEAASRQRALTDDVEATNRRLIDATQAAERDMAMAVAVQRGFLPVYPPDARSWDLAFEFKPVSGVSGDFYDFYVEHGQLRGLALGDVSGHGIASGLISVLARSVFERRFVECRDETLATLLERVNGELQKELAAVDNYLTCLVLRPAGERLEYVNAAHTEPLFRRSGSKMAAALAPKDSDDYKGPPLGLEGIDARSRQLSFRMSRGDALLVYTDGLVEAKNARGELYGVDRLAASFGRAPESRQGAQALLDSVMRDFYAWADASKIADDISAIVLVRT